MILLEVIWGTNPLFQKVGADYYWYLNDHLGTPQRMIESSGRVVWAATYDSFGNARIDTEEVVNNLRASTSTPKRDCITTATGTMIPERAATCRPIR